MILPADIRAAMTPPPLPPALEGFEKIPRHWNATLERYVAKIGPGEDFVSTGSELIATVLGSCIAACVRDVRRSLGGMNHFMLPIDSEAKHRRIDHRLHAALRYGNFAMEHLLNQFYSRGSRRSDLEVKLFGGGQIIASSIRVGEQNIQFARKFLADDGYLVEREDVGGFSGRKLLYDPVCGRALVKRIHSAEEQELVRHEQGYINALQKEPVAGEVELFWGS